MHFKTNLRKHQLSFLLSWVWALAGFLVFILLIRLPVMRDDILIRYWEHRESADLLFWGSTIAYFMLAWFQISVRRLPYANNFEVLIAAAFVMTVLLLVILAATRNFYSGSFLAVFLCFQIIWFGLEVYCRNHYVVYTLAVSPAVLKLSTADFPEQKLILLDDPATLADQEIDAMLVDFNHDLDENWMHFLAYCQNNAIPIIPLNTFLENTWGRVPVEMIKSSKTFTITTFKPYLLVKPVIEWCLALAGIIATSPVMLATALVVKMTSPGPIIYRQVRLGLNGKPFVIYKFRTMLNGADEKGSYSTVENDERLTPVGHTLRKYHLDELPQLFNVLMGNMALVGPRPETVELSKVYADNIPYYFFRTTLKPGVTSWSHIHQGNVSGIELNKIKLSYDIYYMKHISPFIDFYILLKTVWVIVMGIECLDAPSDLRMTGRKLPKQ